VATRNSASIAIIGGVCAIAALTLAFNWTVIAPRSAPRGPTHATDAPAPVIAWTAGLAGRIEEDENGAGGIARVIAGLDALRRLHGVDLIVVDAGSAIPGNDPEDRLRGEAMHEALALARIDTLNVGRGEQQLDIRELTRIRTDHGTSFVSLNVNRLDGSPVDRRSIVVDRNGSRTLITGVADDDLPAGRAQTLRIADPIDAVRRFGVRLAELEPDHAVLLADVSRDTALRLAALDAGFDVVGFIDIHNHSDTTSIRFADGDGSIGAIRLGDRAEWSRRPIDETVDPAARAEAVAESYLLRILRLADRSGGP